MNVLTEDEERQLSRIERRIQYGATFKELSWLVRLARRLEKKCAARQSRKFVSSVPANYIPPPTARVPAKARASR